MTKIEAAIIKIIAMALGVTFTYFLSMEIKSSGLSVISGIIVMVILNSVLTLEYREYKKENK